MTHDSLCWPQIQGHIDNKSFLACVCNLTWVKTKVHIYTVYDSFWIQHALQAVNMLNVSDVITFIPQ